MAINLGDENVFQLDITQEEAENIQDALGMGINEGCEEDCVIEFDRRFAEALKEGPRPMHFVITVT